MITAENLSSFIMRSTTCLTDKFGETFKAIDFFPPILSSLSLRIAFSIFDFVTGFFSSNKVNAVLQFSQIEVPGIFLKPQAGHFIIFLP